MTAAGRMGGRHDRPLHPHRQLRRAPSAGRPGRAAIPPAHGAGGARRGHRHGGPADRPVLRSDVHPLADRGTTMTPTPRAFTPTEDRRIFRVLMRDRDTRIRFWSEQSGIGPIEAIRKAEDEYPDCEAVKAEVKG